MSFNVNVKGLTGEIDIANDCIKKVIYSTDIPLDSDARTKDVGSTIIISGKILTKFDGDPEETTKELSLWSLVAAEELDCYRDVTVEYVAADKNVRVYNFPNAFVVNYVEDYSNGDGVGMFTLTIKQKKDKMDSISINGY